MDKTVGCRIVNSIKCLICLVNIDVIYMMLRVVLCLFVRHMMVNYPSLKLYEFLRKGLEALQKFRTLVWVADFTPLQLQTISGVACS